jgi:hypothetical protein
MEDTEDDHAYLVNSIEDQVRESTHRHRAQARPKVVSPPAHQGEIIKQPDEMFGALKQQFGGLDIPLREIGVGLLKIVDVSGTEAKRHACD